MLSSKNILINKFKIMGPSLIQLLVILAIILLLFGAGKLPKVMSDLGKGIRAFKSSVEDDDKKDKLD